MTEISANRRRFYGEYFSKIVLVAWMASLTTAVPTNRKEGYDKVELINPLQLDQVVGTTPYESIAKLIIAVSLPNPGLTFEGQDVVQSALENIRKDFGRSLVPQFHQRAPPHSILARTSNFAFGTEDQMRTYINILNQNDLRGFSLSVLNSTSFETRMTSKLEEILQAGAKNDDSAIMEPSSIKKYKDILDNYLKSSLISCFNRTLPEELLGGFLLTKLQEISEHDLLPDGYRLAISPTNFPEYLNQSLSDCLFTSQRIYVVVNVPVVRKQANWQIFRAHHPKFAFEDKICTAGPEEDKFYAFDKNHDHVLELDSTLKTTCKMDGLNQLCLIPTIPVKKGSSKKPGNSKVAAASVPTLDKEMDHVDPDHAVSHSCAAAILTKLPMNELKEECGFVCQVAVPEEYFFKEMSAHTVYLTNIKKARIFCPNNNVTKVFERIGAVKVDLHSCDCYLWADKEFYSFQSCLHDKDEAGSMQRSPSDFDVSYLIPLTWTKNSAKSMLMEDNISFRIKNYKEIIDFDWLKKMTGAEREEQPGFAAKYWNFFDVEYQD